MKTVLKIVAGVLLVIIIAAVGVSLYFTNARLQKMIMPKVNEAVGRPVQVESMSVTFFSTFPQPGVSIQNMSIPGDTEQDTLLALDKLVAGVNLFSLFGDEIKMSEIQLNHPRFTYKVYSDSTTNIDFLLSNKAQEDTTSEGYAIDIPYFEITDGQFGYVDQTSATDIKLHDLNANISLHYADLIESTLDIEVGGLYATVDSSNYVNGLPISLTEESTINLDDETVSLEEGTFSIRGLALNLSGNISNWSTTLMVDLAFNSSSDDFGELLLLMPKKYSKGLKTEGALALKGTVKGAVGGEKIPDFNLSAQVKNGYLKNPDLPQPVEDIQLTAQADNDALDVKTLTAHAGENNISGSGRLTSPLEENGVFALDIKGDINLGTVKQFYDISQFDLEMLNGKLNLDIEANGDKTKPKEATFSGLAKLTDGSLKFSKVSKPIENISVDVKGDQSKVNINNMQLQAASNTFSMKGTVNKPLNETQRSIDLNTSLKFDLATIKEFYPISEDTLTMRGLLTGSATLRGKADHIERAVQKGSLSLKNGFINYKKIAKPIEDLTLEATLDGPKMNISDARFKTGDNNLTASGTITNYLSDDRSINLKVTGNAELAQIQDYYDLKPSITTLNGKADLNLTASGPVGKPANMKFSGQMTVKNINMEGHAIVQPVKNLDGQLRLSPTSATLQSLSFNIGSSDMALNGSLRNYMEYLKEEKDRGQTPHLEGSVKSKVLNLDELIDWNDTTSAPTPINLPDLTSSVQADISKMIVTGITMNNLKAQAGTTPKQIKLDEAKIELFGGKANGSFVWDVPQPDQTKISFKGSLDSLQTKDFFKAYPILGKNSEFHKYISGAFSADVNYSSKLDSYLQPIMKTAKMDGSLGMSKSRLQNYPVQEKVASFLQSDELNNIVLDKWESTYTLDDNIFNIEHLRLTSGDIGLEMNGTQNFATEDINYQIKVLLPPKFKGPIASVITKQAADALTQNNGTIMAPLRVSGTYDNPKIQPDKEVIAPIVKDYLKGKAGKVLKGLFGN